MQTTAPLLFGGQGTEDLRAVASYLGVSLRDVSLKVKANAVAERLAIDPARWAGSPAGSCVSALLSPPGSQDCCGNLPPPAPRWGRVRQAKLGSAGGMMKLTDNEIRDVVKYLEGGRPLPEAYRFLLFEEKREVELVWNGKTSEVCNVVLPFQTIEHVDEPRVESGTQKKEAQLRRRRPGQAIISLKTNGSPSERRKIEHLNSRAFSTNIPKRAATRSPSRWWTSSATTR